MWNHLKSDPGNSTEACYEMSAMPTSLTITFWTEVRERRVHCEKRGTFGEGGLFSSSENEKDRSSLFLLCLSAGSEADISLWVGEEEHDFFSDISDSSCSSSCCSEVLPSLRESSSPSSGSSSSSPPLPWGKERRFIENQDTPVLGPQNHLLLARDLNEKDQVPFLSLHCKAVTPWLLDVTGTSIRSHT